MNNKIYVSIISRHEGHWGMFTAFQQAAGYAVNYGYQPLLAPLVGDSLVSRARNTSLRNFLDTDCDWFFTLDDDIAMPPETFIKLIQADKPMVGGFYRLKKLPPEGDDWNIRDMIAFRGLNAFVLGDDDLVEVDYISTGCVMHKRSFIEEMVAHYPELAYKENVTLRDMSALYQPYVYNEEYLSEDWAFCQRALDKGYKLYMHSGVLCVHWGLYQYGFNEIMKQVNERK